MEKKNPTPAWLSATMSDSGLTKTVIDYLQNPRKKLDAATLTWPEFLLILSVQEAAFTQTHFFKKWMKVYGEDIPSLENAFKILGDDRTSTRSLIIEHLPITSAVRLCTNFYELVRLFRKVNSADEREFVLEAIAAFSAVQEFSRSDLEAYYKITEGFPIHRAAAIAMINVFILATPREAYFLSSEIPLSSPQIIGLCKKIDANETGLGYNDLFSLYRRSKNVAILNSLMKKIEAAENKDLIAHLFESITQRITSEGGEKRSTMIRLLFPLLCVVVKHMPGSVLSHKGWKSIIPLLPPYEKDNEQINFIINKAVEYYDAYEYGLLFDDFVAWYSYAEKDILWVPLYVKNIISYGPDRFTKSVAAFALCADEVIIDTCIDQGVGLMENVNEDLLKFMDWLKTQPNDWYEKTKTLILENNYLEQWWQQATYAENKKAYLTLLTHFS